MKTITTEGGTTFVEHDGQVTITRPDQPGCVVPIDDLEEFFEDHFEPMASIPPGFDFVEYRSDAVVHMSHPNFAPMLIKAQANAVQPYRLMCEICGAFVTASTPEAAVDLWNERFKKSPTEPQT